MKAAKLIVMYPTPTDVAVATWEMGPYLGPGVLEAGIDACVSTWNRMAPNTIPTGAKAGGNDHIAARFEAAVGL